ncbi:hypothetical protein BLNAU_16138 [Blattamonas nauphoetae]|uniref:Uncharacterized protein n=1 Tax=Blattamonas nauphoetae TaxID=2049346 RepID=A0ABQ9XC50_9EUKA|nr:hypothetical protein BLNAU_16138 [Blattamonas nauphoetae]
MNQPVDVRIPPEHTVKYVVQQNGTIHELLLCEDLISELRAQPEFFINFLNNPHRIQEILAFSIGDSVSTDHSRIKHAIQTKAIEILSEDIKPIETILKQDIHVQTILSTISPRSEDNLITIHATCTILGSLLHRNFPIWNTIFETREIPSILLNKLAFYPVANLLTIFFKELATSKGITAIAEIVQKFDIVNRLFSKLEESNDPIVTTNIELVFTEICSLYTQSTRNILFSTILTDSTLSLAKHILSAPWKHNSFIHTLRILKHSVVCTQEGTDPRDYFDLKRDEEKDPILRKPPQSLITFLGDLHFLDDILHQNWVSLHNSRQFDAHFPIPTFSHRGDLHQQRFGSGQIEVVSFLNALLSASYDDEIESLFMASPIVPTLISLLVVSPTNSILHSEISSFLEFGLTQRSNCFLIFLLRDCKLDTFLITSFRRFLEISSESSSVPVSDNPAFLANLRSLAKTIQSLSTDSPNLSLNNRADWEKAYDDFVQQEVTNQDKSWQPRRQTFWSLADVVDCEYIELE